MAIYPVINKSIIIVLVEEQYKNYLTFLRGSIQVWGVAGQSTGSPP